MEGVIGLVCCILCAFPFLVVGHYNRNSREPISFWSGDRNLKTKVKDVQGYNKEMSKLYIKCAMAFIASGIVCVVNFGVGIVCILFESTLGIYIVWRIYKSILSRHS